MTHRILLADDSVTIRKVVELTFSDEDFTIDSVGDGAQALEHARAERPDIVISDVIMPGLNGYELCQQIKSDAQLRSIPFLFLKGTFESFDEQKARACGADGFIVKPFESQEMIARVKELIASGPVAAAVAPTPPARPVSPAPEPIPVAPQPLATPEPPRPAPQPVAAAPAPRPAPQPIAPPAAAAPVPQAPRPGPPAMPPRPMAPPPIPARPAPQAPTVPPAVPGPMRPAAPPPPPPPPRPERPFSPPLPPPPGPGEPEPFRMPEMPFEAAAPQRTPAPIEEFGFDFGETVAQRPAAAEAPRAEAPAVTEQSAETDEDLWSEVSLRDRGADILEAPGSAGAAATWEDAGAIGIEEPAPQVDEAAFVEVGAGGAGAEPPPAAEEFVEFTAPVAPAAVRFEEAPVEPAEAAAAPAGVSVDRVAVERAVAEQVEAAVKKALEPLVRDAARGMVEAIAWEVIPELAEAMIRAEIERIRQSTRTD